MRVGDGRGPRLSVQRPSIPGGRPAVHHPLRATRPAPARRHGSARLELAERRHRASGRLGSRCVLSARRRKRRNDTRRVGDAGIRAGTRDQSGDRPRLRPVCLPERQQQCRADQPPPLAGALRRGPRRGRPHIQGLRQRSSGGGRELHHNRGIAAGAVALQQLHRHPRAAARADISLHGAAANGCYRRDRGCAHHIARPRRRRERPAELARRSGISARAVRSFRPAPAPHGDHGRGAGAPGRMRQPCDAAVDPGHAPPEGDRRAQRARRGAMGDRSNAACGGAGARHRRVAARAVRHVA